MPKGPGGQIVSTTTAVGKLQKTLGLMEGEFAKALAGRLDPVRFARTALSTMRKSPKLLECSEASIMSSLLESAALGLEPDGLLGWGYLIPYKKECTFQIGYKGLRELVRRSGDVLKIETDIIRKGDKWSFERGTEPRMVHKPTGGPGKVDPKNATSRLHQGRAIEAVYATATLRGGVTQFEVMWIEEIDRIRSMSPSGKKPDGPWTQHFPEMARKTVLKRLCKVLPVSAEVQRVVASDELREIGKPVEPTEEIKAAVAAVVDEDAKPE